MKYLDNRGLVKTIYVLMLVDGIVTDTEMSQFLEIGVEIDTEGFSGYKDEIIKECNERLTHLADDQDYYDILQEYVDSIIDSSSSTDIVVPSFVIWNLFAVAYNEQELDEDELRLIRHIARKMNMDKSIYLELESYMKTMVDLESELSLLNASSSPYSEIRPRVDEVERRKNTILEAVKTLINDEVYSHSQPDECEEKTSEIKQKMEQVADKLHDSTEATLKNMKTTFSEKVAPAASDVGDKLKKGFKTTTQSISDKSTSILSRFKKKNNSGGEE